MSNEINHVQQSPQQQQQQPIDDSFLPKRLIAVANLDSDNDDETTESLVRELSATV